VYLSRKWYRFLLVVRRQRRDLVDCLFVDQHLSFTNDAVLASWSQREVRQERTFRISFGQSGVFLTVRCHGQNFNAIQLVLSFYILNCFHAVWSEAVVGTKHEGVFVLSALSDPTCHMLALGSDTRLQLETLRAWKLPGMIHLDSVSVPLEFTAVARSHTRSMSVLISKFAMCYGTRLYLRRSCGHCSPVKVPALFVLVTSCMSLDELLRNTNSIYRWSAVSMLPMRHFAQVVIYLDNSRLLRISVCRRGLYHVWPLGRHHVARTMRALSEFFSDFALKKPIAKQPIASVLLLN